MPSLPCPGPLSRRQFLKIGALSLGAGLGGVVPYQLASENGRPASDTAVIFIWLPGGPPHMETYDLKPDAPLEYRGEFRPIRTVVPGRHRCARAAESDQRLAYQGAQSRLGQC